MPATNELLQEGRYRVSQPVSPDGTFFEAYDTVRNTTVLVREFPVHLNKVTTVSQRESIQLAFASQAKALSEIGHESLLHIQDYFSEIDRQFLVMESVEGEALYDLLCRNKKPFDVREVVKWADEMLDALNYLHTRKPAVIHRNIKPQNLRLHASGKVKLLGVGLCGGYDIDPVDVQPDTNDLRYSPMEQIWPGLDAASQKVITNSYDDRSERILKEPLDARSDIYSLGATLYFLVTGREPVDPLERSIDILEGKLDPLREPTKVDSTIPAEISDVLMKALEIKRENRYDSAMIMRQVLQTAVSRVEERVADDAREEAEAAEIIRLAAQSRSAVATEEAKQAAEAQKRAQEEQQAHLENERRVAEERVEAERIQAEQAEAKRLEAERAAEERAAEQRAAAERAEREKVEAQRIEAERAEAKRIEAERAEAKRVEADRAEAKRLEAQRAEAERTKKEQAEAEARRAEELLELPVSAEVVAYRDGQSAVDEDELAAVLEELEKAEARVEKPEQEDVVEVSAEPNVSAKEVPSTLASEPVQVFDRALDSSPEEQEVEDESAELFSGAQRQGSSLPIPAIAGGAVLVIVLGIGGWFALSGSSEPPKPQAVQVQVAQPVEPDPSPTVEPIVTGQTESPEVSTALEVADGQTQPASPKAAPSAKPKKPEAKSAADKKKAVTVDDLINDN